MRIFISIFLSILATISPAVRVMRDTRSAGEVVEDEIVPDPHLNVVIHYDYDPEEAGPQWVEVPEYDESDAWLNEEYSAEVAHD